MNCPGCNARNPIGNKFCRECGQKIPLEENILMQEEAQKAESERSRERAAQLLTKAFTLSQHGKPAEALPLAEEATQLLPESTSALTLCSTLYERQGQNDKAIAMMEKVVALNPDSAVDADKLERLRRGVHLLPQRPVIAEEPEETSSRRWLPLAAAGGVFVLVLALGISAVVKANQKSKSLAPLAVTEVSGPSTAGFFNGQSSRVTPGGLGGGPLAPPVMQTRTDPFAPLGRRPMNATPEPLDNPAVNRTRVRRPGSNPVLPDPRNQPASPQSGVEGVPPVTIQNNGTGTLPPLGGVQRNQEAIPAGPPPVANPPQTPPGNNAGNTNGAPTEGENSGYIRVREHGPGTGSGNSGESRTSSLGGDPLLRAQTLQASGKYREAIPAFREALAAGAASGEVQQGIALCHQRLGEKAPARSAYQQAIVAFEAQVRAGRGVDQAQRGISACRAALDVLGT